MEISVAMCTYNGEHYIEQQIKSILSQTKLPDEIVVCDDGSTDNTLQIINDLAKKTHVPIRVFENKTNLGFIQNFQQALTLCNGDLIFLSDQDDEWVKDKIDTIVHYFQEQQHLEVVFTNAILKRNEVLTDIRLWDVVGFNAFELKHCQTSKGLLSRFLINSNVATGATMALKKSFVKASFPLFDSPNYFHDYLFAMQGAVNGTLAFIETPLIYYRIHEAQTAGLDESDKKRITIKLLIRKLVGKKWQSNLGDLISKENLLRHLIEHASSQAPQKNIDYVVRMLEHYESRKKIINKMWPLNMFHAFKEYLSGRYKLSYTNKRDRLKFFLKDIIT